ncbi:RNA-binding domain-containing protein [Mycena filopes]|nr:RNA-binding domain-containing protein [Mycena filopes]
MEETTTSSPPTTATNTPSSPPSTSSGSGSSPPPPPTDDAIEAVIQMATAAAQNSSSSSPTFPLRDTRTQLFVANLPYRVRWQDLKDLFRRAGTVLRADVSLGPDNRSRGYGTVLLATAEDAGRAVDMFSGYSWQGRVLEVRADRVRDFDQPFANEEVEESMYAPPMGRNLFVGNLPFHVQWQDLKDLFRQAGTIVRADVALGPDGRSRGFGTVVFATEKDARRAVGMFSGVELEDTRAVVAVEQDVFDSRCSSGLLFISAAIPCHGPMSVRPMACRWE